MVDSKKYNLQSERKNLTADGSEQNLRLSGKQKTGNGSATETGKKSVKSVERRKRKISVKSMCVSGIVIKCDSAPGHLDTPRRRGNVREGGKKERRGGKVSID